MPGYFPAAHLRMKSAEDVCICMLVQSGVHGDEEGGQGLVKTDVQVHPEDAYENI